ncbi:DUF1754-domain-containing protein [Polychaeton citri CBS 116435]|uniref:DUF1754-domain-containing protein n=1 Tax=Polychaeton citri CBS 116435 TaxID=1314669 RepID=A0A9P4QJ27_9PEZI|nr:DUF1754-domain-containing protein [Polychaeton citri CBS 116435]
MPSSEYTSAVGGGLKLKGAKDAGIKKKKKRDKSKGDDVTKSAEEPTKKELPLEESKDTSLERASSVGEESSEAVLRIDGDQDDGKTEAERRYEERRRKRLDERLKKDGLKSHKQRVEELNKYLSNLSEHHDMPRIGPG